MADDEQFFLCWNNFNSNLSAGFHDSLCRGDLVDVTLAAEGQFVKAHRLVLSVCSPYFRKMFTQMPANQHAFVFLKDVSHSALKDLIQFMYCGEVNVKQDALPALISTAEALQIKGFTNGEPAPSQSPAKPSTPAPQQTIPAPTMTATSPRVRTHHSTTRPYKLESEDSGDDEPTIVLQQQQQTQSQSLVQSQKRPAQRSITPHTVPSIKRVKNSDPLEATDPTQITVQTVSDNKSSGEPEFIDLPIDIPTKSEPDYAEDAGEVDAAKQEATYVEDDSYGDMKYDESYFTENDESATAPTTSTTVKQQAGAFSESYVSDAGDQSTTEAQDHKVTVMHSTSSAIDLTQDDDEAQDHSPALSVKTYNCRSSNLSTSSSLIFQFDNQSSVQSTYTTSTTEDLYGEPSTPGSPCTLENLRRKRLGGPPKQHSDMPDPEELQKLNEAERKLRQQRYKNNEASRKSKSNRRKREEREKLEEQLLQARNEELQNEKEKWEGKLRILLEMYKNIT